METLSTSNARRLLPEWMDEPDLDSLRHIQALNGLARLNWWSGSSGIVWSAIRRKVSFPRNRPLRVLDLACGSGDVMLGLWRRASRHNIPVTVVGLDRSSLAVDQARARAQRAGAPLDFQVGNVLEIEYERQFDVVTSSLFLHHLRESEAVCLLSRMAAATSHLVLINDLRRSVAGLLLAEAASRLLTRSPVVHVDAARSVAGAFSAAELRDLADRANLTGATVTRRWPCRLLLSWQRNS